MIHLVFSYWWLLLPLALVLGAIPYWKARDEHGLGEAMVFCFWALICLAIFLIVLACLVGYSIGHL
ncbi:MAG: hypothetical protein ACRYFX_19615 [Janthinobacterium lividum]